MRSDDFSQLVGNTPVVRFRSPDLPGSARLWIKLESFNPTGSVKDRACLFNIRDAISREALRKDKTILDASSGNMACSLAYFGKVLGFKVTVVCGSKLTKDKESYIRFFGANLIRHGDFTIHGNEYCRNMVNEENDTEYCFIDQLHNPANPRAYFETMGPELLDDFPSPVAVVGTLGSGGTMLGTARYLRQQGSDARVIVVEAAPGTKLPGTGAFIDGDYITPFIKAGIEERLFQERATATMSDAVKRTRELREQGFFVGLQTGAAVTAAIAEARKHGLCGDIIAISGDSGWKNLDALIGAGVCP